MIRLSATHWKPPGGTWTSESTSSHMAAMHAAADECERCERLYAERGRVAHLMPPWLSHGMVKSVLCRDSPRKGDWLGTGSQDEYERAAALGTCSLCWRMFLGYQRCGNSECPCQKWPRRGEVGRG